MGIFRKVLVFVFMVFTPSVFAEQKVAEFSEEYVSFFGVQGNFSRLTVNNTTLESQGLRPYFDYFLTSRLAVEVGYAFLPSPEDGSVLLSGFDMGAKVYPFSPSVETIQKIDGIHLRSWSTLTHYFALGYRQRTLSLASKQIGFGGYSIAYGLNWHLPAIIVIGFDQKVYINTEISRESLSPVTGAKLNINTASLGMGVQF